MLFYRANKSSILFSEIVYGCMQMLTTSLRSFRFRQFLREISPSENYAFLLLHKFTIVINSDV